MIALLIKQLEFQKLVDTSTTYGIDAGRALDLWTKLARAFTTFNKLTIKDISAYGLTQPQFAVLESIGHLGPMTIGQLCKKMLVSGGNMTVVLDNLQREGLIERITNKDDRRSVEVRLSAEGKKLFNDIFPKHASYVASIAKVLTPDEQRDLAAMLKKLGTGLSEKFEG